jgi:PAS domain S-box-containing protein
MEFQKLLNKQIKKHLPAELASHPEMTQFLNSINDCFIAHERDRELLTHAFSVAEQEYREMNEILLKEDDLKKRSLDTLKHAIKKTVSASGIGFEGDENDLLKISDYLSTQVTERKKAEKELSRTINLLETLLSNINSGILVEDENRNILFTNKMFCEAFQIPLEPDQLKGINCSDSAEQTKHLFKHPDDFVNRIATILSERKVVLSEELTLTNGQYLERDFIPIYIHNNYKGHLWNYRNITDRKKDENDLKYLISTQEAILNGTNYSIIFTDVNGTIKAFNRGAEKMLGYKAEEMINKTSPAILHDLAEVKTRAKELTAELSETIEAGFEVFVAKPKRGIVETLEWTYIRKNGQKFPVSLTICFIKNENNDIIGFLGIARDISEEKQAQEALKLSEEKYKNIIEKSTDIIYKTNKAGFFTFVNPVAERITGYSARELFNMHFSELIEEKHKSKAREFYKKQVMDRKPTTYFEFPILTKEGAEVWIGQSVQYTQVNDKDYELTALAIDISERKHHEKTIRLKDEKYRNIIANMNMGLVEVDTHEVIRYCNNSFCEQSGYSEEELVGTNVVDLMVVKSNQNIIKNKIQKRQSGLSDTYELQMRNKRGELRWWIVSGAPNYDDSGKLIGSIGINIDVTERKKLEEELVFSKHKAEESSKAKESFLANMSHEIRTPLNAIIGMVRELSREDLTGEQRVYLQNASIASQHLYSILNNILDISKIDSGEFNLDLVDFSLNGVFNELISIMGNKAEEKRLSLNVSVQQGIKRVFIGDPLRLKQILINLVGNALKFTDKGSVGIQCELVKETKSHQTLKLSIIDTGVGMDASYVKKLFTKFSQEDLSTSRKYGGTGLGMVITQELVHLMQGTISVQSEKNSGTTVMIELTLPIGDETKIEKEQVLESHWNHAPIKILLAEDNEFNRLTATKILERTNCIVTEVENGAEAVKILKSQSFDLILMDLQMPVMDGIEATQLIRKELKIATPIVALTANAFKNEINNCLKAGMDDCITKPYEEKLLVDTVLKHAKIRTVDTIEPSDQKKLYSLSKLKATSRGDKTYVRKMIGIFVAQGTVSMEQIKKALEAGDLITVAKLSHKIKPSIDGMDIHSLKEEIREMEKIANEGRHSERLIWLVNYADGVLKQVMTDLRKEQ